MDDDAPLDQPFVQAWLTAAADLGIEVVAPFVLPVENGEIRCVAVVKQFGYRNGTLVSRRGDVAEWQEMRDLLDQVLTLG